jgi:hypothetical protein
MRNDFRVKHLEKYPNCIRPWGWLFGEFPSQKELLNIKLTYPQTGYAKIGFQWAWVGRVPVHRVDPANLYCVATRVLGGLQTCPLWYPYLGHWISLDTH